MTVPLRADVVQSTYLSTVYTPSAPSYTTVPTFLGNNNYIMK